MAFMEMAMAMVHPMGYKPFYEWMTEPNLGRLWLLLVHALMVYRLYLILKNNNQIVIRYAKS